MDKIIEEDIRQLAAIATAALARLGMLKERESRQYKLLQLNTETMPENIRKVRQGLYQGRKQVNGQAVSVYAPTSKECQTKLKQAIAEAETRPAPPKQQSKPSKDMTYGAYLALWYDEYQAPRYGAEITSGAVNNEICIRLHTPVWLKETLLKDINTDLLETALNGIDSTRMRRYTYDVYNGSLRAATEKGLLHSNPVDSLPPPEHDRDKGIALTRLEQAQLMAELQRLPRTLRDYFKYCLLSGCRRAEAMRLNVDADVDWVHQCIKIRGTKTDYAPRVIPLTSQLDALLRPYKGQGRIWHMRLDTVTKLFKRLSPAHRLHDLRHTFATRCLESGIAMRVVQQWLGHASITTTAGIYTDVLDEFARQEAGKLDINLSDSGADK